MIVSADLGKPGAVHYPTRTSQLSSVRTKKWSTCIQHRATDGPHRQSLGADLHDAKEILGHSTIAVTSDLYGHGVPVLQRELMNRVSGLFEAPPEP
jgi:hypothetical protein